MDSTVIDNNIIDFEWYDEEDSSVLMAAESPWRGFAVELQDLHYLKGASFINQLKLIINSGEFFPVEGDLLPNPKGIRSADFIFVRKGVLKLFDLKTITGKNSVGNRLAESIGQTERVLLNMQTDYNIRRLTLEIKRYFEMSAAVQEVLIYSGSKEISIKRNIASSKGFLKMMMNSFR